MTDEPEQKKSTKKTRKFLPIVLIIVALACIAIYFFPNLDDKKTSTAIMPRRSKPVNSNKNKSSFDRKNSILNILPDTTLCFWHCRSSTNFFQNIGSNQVKKYLIEVGIYDVLKNSATTATQEKRNELESKLPKRITTLDPVTDYVLNFLEHPLNTGQDLSKLFPGELCLAIAHFDDKDSLPIPDLLFAADISSEISEKWLHNTCQTLEDYFGKKEMTSTFIHNSDTRTDDEKIDFHYHKLGDKDVNLSIGIWKNKKLLISNNDNLFQKTIRAYAKGKSKNKESSSLDIHPLINTKHFEKLSNKISPFDSDLYFYTQNSRLTELIRKTLLTTDPDLVFTKQFGLDNCLGIACSLFFKGYAIQEKIMFLYDYSLPEETFLSCFNSLAAKTAGESYLEAIVPDTAVAVGHFQIDYSRLLTNALELEKKLYHKPVKTDSTPLSDMVNYWQGRYKIYLADMLKKLKEESLFFISKDENDLGAGIILSIKGKNAIELKESYRLLNERFQLAFRNLTNQFPGQIKVTTEDINGQTIHRIDIDPSLSNSESTLKQVLSLLSNKTELEKNLLAKNDNLNGIVDGIMSHFLSLNIAITPQHIFMATKQETITKMIADLNTFSKLNKKNLVYNNEALSITLKNRLSSTNNHGLIWIDTKKLLNDTGLFYNAHKSSFPIPYDKLKFEEKDLTDYFPNSVIKVEFLSPRQSMSKKTNSAYGIYIESYSAIPQLNYTFLKWSVNNRLKKIFGPVDIEAATKPPSQ